MAVNTIRMRNILKRLLPTLKNLKVSEKTHHELRIAAANANVPMGTMVETCIELALSEEKKLMRLLEVRTKAEPQGGKG